MPKSFPSAKVLSRLGIRGTVLVTEGTDKYEGFVPKLNSIGKLDPSVVNMGSVELGDVEAEFVTFQTPPSNDPTAANVREAIDNITKDDGLALLRSKNLLDVADPEAAFENIKAGATIASGGAVATAGVVGIASQTDVEAQNDTATETSLTTVNLAVSPSTLFDSYINKFDSTAQTLVSQLVLPSDPATALQAATKQYVDGLVAGAFTIPIGKTVFVDSVNGSDTTAERGKMAKPALTLTKAKTLATSGDTVIVGPGTYNANDLAKSGVNWYFSPGAIVYYTTGGTAETALFSVNSNETCNILGYGEFWNMHASAANRYVLYVVTGGKCVFEANWVQSARTPIFVDCGADGHVQINIRDTLRSDDLAGTGACAAKLVSGVCAVRVGREIYSNGSQSQAGLEFGAGTVLPASGWQTVECPRIIGKYNAIHFNGTLRSQVAADICYATDGPAIKVSSGTKNTVTIPGALYSSSVSYPTVYMTAGRLQCNDTCIYATTGQPGIYMNGIPYDASIPYLILNNCEIWCRGYTENAISAGSAGYFYVRIVGATQSDCNEPTDVVRVGGTWDYVPTSDA